MPLITIKPLNQPNSETLLIKCLLNYKVYNLKNSNEQDYSFTYENLGYGSIHF